MLGPRQEDAWDLWDCPWPANLLCSATRQPGATPAMSDTTKPAAPSQAVDDKDKGVPAPAPVADPIPVSNSKGEDSALEGFRVRRLLCAGVVDQPAARVAGSVLPRGPGVGARPVQTWSWV